MLAPLSASALARLPIVQSSIVPIAEGDPLSQDPEVQGGDDGTWTWRVPGGGKPGYANGVVIAHFEQIGFEVTQAPSPEAMAGLKELIIERSMAWLDEPVTMFGGKTPRQAAKDPGLREQVERQIRTYPDSQGPDGPIVVPRKRMLEELGF